MGRQLSGYVLGLAVLAACGSTRLRVADGGVRFGGYHLQIPAGFSRADAGPSRSYRVVLLKGPEGQREAPTIRHSEFGPTHELSAEECARETESMHRTLGATLAMGGRKATVGPATLINTGMLGPVCGLSFEDRARASAKRLFYVRHQGYTVICEANDAEHASALCDEYLGSATR